ncbi:MAG: response regulator [Cyanobacteria bacterium P01_E01_bin.34]
MSANAQSKLKKYGTLAMTKTILVIDDDIAVSTLLVKVLQAKGYNAIGVIDPAEGLEQVRTLHPELIICDVIMPSMSGYEVLETLRQSASTASIPFMFLTSKSSRRDVIEGLTLGADNYLSKPINPEDILAAVAARFSDLETHDSASTTHPGGVSFSSQLCAEYPGWWAAVEPSSNRCFLGKTREQAYQAAVRAYPSGIFLYQELQAA